MAAAKDSTTMAVMAPPPSRPPELHYDVHCHMVLVPPDGRLCLVLSSHPAASADHATAIRPPHTDASIVVDLVTFQPATAGSPLHKAALTAAAAASVAAPTIISISTPPIHPGASLPFTPSIALESVLVQYLKSASAAVPEARATPTASSSSAVHALAVGTSSAIASAGDKRKRDFADTPSFDDELQRRLCESAAAAAPSSPIPNVSTKRTRLETASTLKTSNATGTTATTPSPGAPSAGAGSKRKLSKAPPPQPAPDDGQHLDKKHKADPHPRGGNKATANEAHARDPKSQPGTVPSPKGISIPFHESRNDLPKTRPIHDHENRNVSEKSSSDDNGDSDVESHNAAEVLAAERERVVQWVSADYAAWKRRVGDCVTSVDVVAKNDCSTSWSSAAAEEGSMMKIIICLSSRAVDVATLNLPMAWRRFPTEYLVHSTYRSLAWTGTGVMSETMRSGSDGSSASALEAMETNTSS